MRFLAFVLLFVLLSACTSRQEKAEARFLEGVEYHFLGMNKEAMDAFNAVIALQADNPEAYFYRANVWFNLGSIEKAMLDLDKAIELNPAYADAYFNRGNMWFYLGDKDKACDDWREAEALGKPNVGDKTRHCF